MKDLFRETADIFKVTNREICLFIISAVIIVAFLGYLEQREKAAVSAVLSGEVMLTSNQSKDTLSCTCKEYKKADCLRTRSGSHHNCSEYVILGYKGFTVDKIDENTSSSL